MRLAAKVVVINQISKRYFGKRCTVWKLKRCGFTVDRDKNRPLASHVGAEDLLANANDVAVVAARSAWPEYNDLHAYVCQPNRPFQQVTRLGLYSKGVIYPLVPKIVATFDEVEMKENAYDGELGILVNKLVKE